MKIVTWNVNGIRSFDKKWKETLISLDADIICVQETKVTSNFSELMILRRGFQEMRLTYSSRVPNNCTGTIIFFAKKYHPIRPY